MQANYNLWLVALSIVVAMAAAYTALKLAARIADAQRSGSRLWLLGGAVAMGIGIWSMHFIGMLAFSLPIPLSYGVGTTLASLVIGIITSGFALAISSRPQLSLQRLAVGALVMGAGICAMHYSGMSAIQIVPMITYEPMLVAASIAIAVSASFVALWLFFKLRSGRSRLMALARVAAAVIMGLAIAGMHYTAMGASKFAPDSYCLGGATFDNDWLALTIGVIALCVLAIALITAVYDAHLGSQARKDARRLALVNTDLQHQKNLLALATRAADISSWEIDLPTQRRLWTENELESLRAAGVDTQRCPDALVAITHPDDRSNVYDAVRKASDDGKSICSYRFRVVTPASETVHVEAHAQILRDEHGEPVRILGVSWDVTEQVLQEQRRRELQSQLRDASREAGMAEVATGVLHNVGNVLNSLGVSAALVESRLRNSRAGNVLRIAGLLTAQDNQIGPFLDADPRRRQALEYLTQVGQHLAAENEALKSEVAAITTHVGHIRTIVAAQQAHARRGGVTEVVDVAELVDNTIAVQLAASPDVSVRREYHAVPPLTLDRHKLIQILGNLLSNARHALIERMDGPRVLAVRIRSTASDSITIEVEDTGVGIASDALERLFEFGFTTKKDGHGFGLHSSAILAKELGGELDAHSDGVNCGARFVLRLPLGEGERERKSA